MALFVANSTTVVNELGIIAFPMMGVDGRKSRVPVRVAGHPGGYALAAAIQVAVNAR